MHTPTKLSTNQKGLAPIFIVLLVAAVLGGFVIYQKQAKPASKPTPTTQTISSPTSDETVNWKIYTDSTFGISFQYPSDWFVDSVNETNDEHSLSIQNNAPAAAAGRDAFEPNQYKFLISKFAVMSKIPPNPRSFPQISSIDDLKQQIDTSAVKKEKQFEINGAQAYYVEAGNSIFADREPTKMTYLLNGKGLALQIDNLNPVKKSESFYNQILSTFKFLP